VRDLPEDAASNRGSSNGLATWLSNPAALDRLCPALLANPEIAIAGTFERCGVEQESVEIRGNPRLA